MKIKAKFETTREEMKGIQKETWTPSWTRWSRMNTIANKLETPVRNSLEHRRVSYFCEFVLRNCESFIFYRNTDNNTVFI